MRRRSRAESTHPDFRSHGDGGRLDRDWNARPSARREPCSEPRLPLAPERETGIDAFLADRWRSAPLTCNATFAIANDHIVSGYGFTAEPDFVFLVRRSDGAIVQKVPIDSGPRSIELTGNRVHVEAYGHIVDLELR